MLVQGIWKPKHQWTDANGAFTRQEDRFAAPLNSKQIERLWADPASFVLVASHSCPWSHRATLARALLDATLPLVEAGEPRDTGYSITRKPRGSRPPFDTVTKVHQLYTTTDASYSGRATVPILWDSTGGKIVSNASARIVEALDAAYGGSATLFPSDRRPACEDLCQRIYAGLSNAVYEAGFAQRQDLYDKAVATVFRTLDMLEKRLSDRRFLMGKELTVADLHLFPTLARFDLVYGPFFQCTRRRLRDYANLWAYTRDIYALPGVAETVNQAAILDGYYLNDTDRNPHRIVSAMPVIDWTEPANRGDPTPVPLAARDETERADRA